MAEQVQRIQDSLSGSRAFHGRVNLRIEWQGERRRDGYHVHGEVFAHPEGSSAPWESARYFLSKDVPRQELHLAGVTVTLSLIDKYKEGRWWCEFIGEVPMGAGSFFRGPLATWPLSSPGPGPEPDPRPWPDDHGDIISNPGELTPLFPFLWLRPLPGERSLESLRFLRCENPEDLPLVQSLETAADKEAKRKAAADFQAGPDFVSSLKSFSKPLDEAPLLVQALWNIQGYQDRDVLEKKLTALLGETPEEFLNSQQWAQARPKIWQSVMSLCLTTPDVDARQVEGLIDALRLVGFTSWFLQSPQEDSPGPMHEVSLDGRDEEEVEEDEEELEVSKEPAPTSEELKPFILSTEEARHEALEALAVVPNVVALFDPRSTKEGSFPSSPQGWAYLLGIGDLKEVHHRRRGYLPGEIARTVNIMPRELQERSLRTWVRTEEEHLTEEIDEEEGELHNSSGDFSTLDRAIASVVGCDHQVDDLSDITPAYGNMNMTLSGKAIYDECDRQRWDSLAADYARQISHRAGQRVSKTMRSRRIARQVEERELTQLSRLDNRDQSGRLVGVFRWLEEIYELSIQHLGERLILEFMIDDPAQIYRQSRCDQAPKLIPPEEIPPFEKGRLEGSKDLTAENSVEYGAQYGIDVPPPPAQEHWLSAQCTNQPPQLSALLEVPPGYKPSKAQINYVISDDRCVLALALGDKSMIEPPGGSIVGKTLRLPSVQSDGDDEPCQPLPAPAPPQPTSSSLSLDISPELRRIPVSVACPAEYFQVFVEIRCVSEESPSAQFRAWQLQVYDLLFRRYEELEVLYREHRNRRLAAPRKGGHRKIEVQALREKSTQCLASLPNSAAPQEEVDPGLDRFFQRALDWDQCTYQFYPWASGSGPQGSSNWPEQNLDWPDNDELFREFLVAKSARVLVPLRPGMEAAMVAFLLFGQPWPGEEKSPCITAPYIPLIAELLEPGEEEEPSEGLHSWPLRIPTDHLYLEGGTSPGFVDSSPLLEEEEGGER